jgi:hypothetical protein
MKPETMTDLANALLSATPIRPLPVNPLAAKVDRLGLIRAQMDRLAQEAEDIREELEATGLKRVEGQFFTAGVTECKAADRTDWQTIAKKLNASPQLIRAHTKKGTGYTRLLLTAKTVTH